LFHTPNWGAKLVAHLQGEDIGVVGIAGSHYLPATITGWGFNPCQSMHYLQKMSPDKPSELFYVKYIRKEQEWLPAVTVDGVFLAMRKSICSQISFDAMTFQGFHCYDIDICMQAHSQGFRNRIIFDILIEHFSRGSFNKQWIEATETWLNKWKHKLPANAIPVTDSMTFDALWSNTCWYIMILYHNRILCTSQYLRALSYSIQPKYIRFFFRWQPWRVLLWFIFKCRVFAKTP